MYIRDQLSRTYSATGKELGVQSARNSDTDKELGAHSHMIALLTRSYRVNVNNNNNNIITYPRVYVGNYQPEDIMIPIWRNYVSALPPASATYRGLHTEIEITLYLLLLKL